MLLGFLSLPAYSAPGTITNVPLFLSNKAEPNIFFMMDDSGSMNADMMTAEQIAGWGGVMNIASGGNNRDYYFLYDNGNSNSRLLPTQAHMDLLYGGVTASVRGVWRGRNKDYNNLYYNPARTYTPWAGVNNAGTVYGDITNPALAPNDPYLSAGSTRNLTANTAFTTNNLAGGGTTVAAANHYPASYWVWQDTNGNTIVDPDDAHIRIQITAATPVCTNGVAATTAEQFTGACMLRPYASEIQNFANWYSYHRSRELSAKYALSQVIANANKVRMGIATINENVTAAQIRLQSMNPSAITAGNKLNLLDGLFRVTSNNGTPLRRSLQRAGNYFECTGTRPTFSGTGSNCAVETAAVAPATQPAGVCQQNFTVLVSDGERNGGSPGVGNVDNSTNSFTGIYYPTGTAVTQTFSFGGEPYADSDTNTLADVAMDYYERDLHNTLENRVPTICGVDENPAQHMVTFTVGFGVTGNLDLTTLPSHPRRGYAPNCTATTPGADYPWFAGATISTGAERVDDMVHAAYNGRGQYLSAQDPEGFANSLNDTIRAISNRTGAAAAVTFNSSSLSNGTKVFIARFNSTQWSGELFAYPLNSDGSIGTTPDWLAHDLLDARNLSSSTTDRAIVTFDRAAGNGIPFRWANLTASQQNDLKTDNAGALEVTAGFPLANARLDYLRGERGCEIGNPGTCAVAKSLRPRASRLGDLIQSAPVFVGAPRARYPDSAPYPVVENYTKFKSGDPASSGAFLSGANATTRTNMIYVGANDGMLHAFEADTGNEVWAFIPNAIYQSGVSSAGLHKLTESGYEHRYYVDQTPTIVDAYIDIDATGGDDWHTVLVGGLRGGGRGIFALDVTDPDYIRSAATAATKESRLASKIMWEFTSNDDIDMGYSYSQPSIVALGNSTSMEWYVVLGNGYNSNNGQTGYPSVGSNPYSSKLFILKLEGPGADGVWDLGTDYYKLDTRLPAGTSVTEADRNGMSSPAVADYDTDGVADRVYVGDLYGRVWAIDIEGTNPSSWDFVFKSGATPRPFFTATDGDAGSSGNRQPITSKPILAFHPTVTTVTSGSGKNTPNLMVYFGTGQYLASGDLSATSIQSFYGVWDKDVGQRTVNRTTPGSSTNHLLYQPIITTFEASGFRTIDPANTVDYAGGKFGWFTDLPTSGERVVFNPQVRSNIVFFNTLIPSQNPCDFGGSGWIMALDQANGTSPEEPIIDTNGDAVVDSTDVLGTHAAAGEYSSNSIPADSSFLGGSNGGGGGGDRSKCLAYRYITMTDGSQNKVNLPLPCDKVGRLSWRQLKFN